MTKMLKQNSSRHKRVELWAKSIQNFRNIGPPHDIRKNPSSRYARVPQAMAQFALKIEILSYVIGTAPKLEMVRAYVLRPRL